MAAVKNKNTNDDLDREDKAGRLLYQVKLGTPKNKQLQKMMEEPAIRQLSMRPSWRS